jgi:hypothetical protein
LITPYANAGAPRTPLTWTQRYVYDVTDYVSKLQGSATVRVQYFNYSGGFTANVKFAFVEGTPDRDVKSISRLWHGSFPYGGATSINTHFPTTSLTAPAGTVTSDLKFTVTGHGADALGCCEFLSKNYDVVLNGASIATTAIWKTCGNNQLYPQSGTWLYDRANWCPGERTNERLFDLTGITGGSTYDLALQFEPYTGSGGSYTTEATLINYGDFNKVLDGSIEDIISPTNNENHFRQNPICAKPTIRVKNRGSATIATMQIQYGLQDSVMQTYNWSGPLFPLHDTEIVLPDLASLHNVAGATGLNTFVVHITSVNGTADVDPTNDAMTSKFAPSPKWDSIVQIWFRPNNEVATGSATQSETKWEIFDANETVVASRTSANINTTYKDTVTLPTGCYRLQITDGGCDGLHWWVWDSNPGAGVNAGYFTPKKMNGVALPMNGYSYSGTYNNDFGCTYTQYFYTVNSSPVAVTNITGNAVQIEAYPNPAKNSVNVSIDGIAYVNGTLQVIDAIGRTVLQVPCTNAASTLNTENLINGIYTIQFINATSGNKLQTRLLIAK